MSGTAPAIGLTAGLRVIYEHMLPARRRQLLLVMILMVAGAFAELGTIGAVIPFITLLANKDAIDPEWLSVIPGASGHDALATVAAAFMLFALAAGIVRFQLSMSSRRFIYHLGHELAVDIQRRVLLQPYSFHVNRNSSTLLSAFTKTELVVGAMLLPLMHAITGSVIAIVVIALLVAVSPIVTLIVAASLAVTYSLFSMLFRKRLAATSEVQKSSYDELTRVIQESLGGIREVIIDGSERMYLDEFKRIDLRLAETRSTTQLIFLAPHYLIEIVGMLLIAAIAVVLARGSGGIAVALPVLGTLALGAQRLLPLVQDMYRGWSAVQGHRSLFEEVVSLLSLPGHEAPKAPEGPLALRHDIKLEGVSLSYPERSEPALSAIDLRIPAGAMLALVGPTGSGKSSLVDVLMGLLPPTTGRVLLDDMPLEPGTQQAWYRSVAHVPQSIFLADVSIGHNIALSLPDGPPEPDRIAGSAKIAQLDAFVASLPAGYDTLVGERGVRLSGGQRQRLGIARAIYKGAPILILDEATSALDDRIEADVMSALKALRAKGRTIIIVAHRLSTIRHCDLVARLDHGRLCAFGPVSEVMVADVDD